MKDKRNTGLLILVILEIAALIIVGVFGIMKVIKPDKDDRTINRKETEITETTTEQTSTEEEATTLEEAPDVVEPEAELSDKIKERISKLTLEEKVSLLFVITPEKLTDNARVTLAGEVTRNALDTTHIGGLSYSYENYEDDEQISDLLSKTQSICIELMGYAPIMFGCDESSNALVYATRKDMSGLSALLKSEDGVREASKNEKIDVAAHYSSETTGGASDIVLFDVSSEDINISTLEDAILTYREINEYNGIVMAGRLDADDVTGEYTSADAAVACIKAGADMLYAPENLDEACKAVVDAVNNEDIAEEVIDKAAGRILTYMDSIGYLADDVTGEDNEE